MVPAFGGFNRAYAIVFSLEMDPKHSINFRMGCPDFGVSILGVQEFLERETQTGKDPGGGAFSVLPTHTGR